MKRFFYFLLIFFIVSNAKAQSLPFWNDIQQFKKQDSISFPASGQILFIGSSSFTFWKDVNDYFPGYHILNRGFGGSQLTDLIRYRYEVIYPYQPRQIVMYCGENDFAANDTITPATVTNRFITLFQLIRAKYPTVPFAYVSMKPSPSRKHLMEKFETTNKQIEVFLKTQKSAIFIDVFNKMLQANGQPMDDIFVGDNLHMNAQGYTIWQKVIKPYLRKSKKK
ncbi:MAG: GDSL-type esterase/lipase family protein [Niabella sp.]